jgi:hypothetical protein
MAKLGQLMVLSGNTKIILNKTKKMKNEKKYITNTEMPSAFICINKSRLKIYNKESDPTFYLNNGDSFQIELFNPTSNLILAKIYLNNNIISQGGLVLRPGERVFLERYLDVAKRFKFDTYEVSNTKEVQKAIENNGDFKVEFYDELKRLYPTLLISNNPSVTYNYNQLNGTGLSPIGITTSNASYGTTLNLTGTVNLSSSSNTYLSNNKSFNGTSATFTSSVGNFSSNSTLRKCNKTIETGRVEAGSNSDQKLQTVDKSFYTSPFHTVEYKLLPISQKVNTSEDINIKRYCTNCGAKQKPEFKFCPSCGKKC